MCRVHLHRCRHAPPQLSKGRVVHCYFNACVQNWLTQTLLTSASWRIYCIYTTGVFNITVDGCTFGTDGSDFDGLHLKTMRGRGGSIHGVRLRNSVFHSESSVKQPMPISASLFYSGNPAPTNASATPHVYDVRVENVTIYMLPKLETRAGGAGRVQRRPKGRQQSGAIPTDAGPSYPKTTFQFIGLSESVMHDVSFDGVKVVGGVSHGWYCEHTRGFTFKDVSPMPSKESGCMN